MRGAAMVGDMSTLIALATFLVVAAGVALMSALAAVPLVLEMAAEEREVAPVIPLAPGRHRHAPTVGHRARSAA